MESLEFQIKRMQNILDHIRLSSPDWDNKEEDSFWGAASFKFCLLRTSHLILHPLDLTTVTFTDILGWLTRSKRTMGYTLQTKVWPIKILPSQAFETGAERLSIISFLQCAEMKTSDCREKKWGPSAWGTKIGDEGFECPGSPKALRFLLASFLSSLLALVQFDFCY